jgi:hypothetical protein
MAPLYHDFRGNQGDMFWSFCKFVFPIGAKSAIMGENKGGMDYAQHTDLR